MLYGHAIKSIVEYSFLSNVFLPLVLKCLATLSQLFVSHCIHNSVLINICLPGMQPNTGWAGGDILFANTLAWASGESPPCVVIISILNLVRLETMVWLARHVSIIEHTHS